jgi:hypothetical protein
MAEPSRKGASEIPVPNADVLRKDPMSEFFGPGSNVKLIGDPNDEVPDEVRALLEQHGLAKHAFQCMLKELPEGARIGDGVESSSQNSSYIKGWTRSIPSFEYIKNNHGPGVYILAFSWRGQKEDGTGSEAKHDEVTIEISQKAMEDYKKARLQSKIKNASEVSTQVKDELIEKNLEGQIVRSLVGESDRDRTPPAEAAKQYITSAMETVKMLGIPVGQQQAKTIEWDKLLPAVAPLILAWLQHQRDQEVRRADDFNKMLMLMVTQGQQSNHQMIEMFTRVQSGSGAGNQFIKEFTDMIKGAVDVKALLSPPVETLGDKIFRVVESVAPQILSIAATTAQNAAAAQRNPIVGFAKEYVQRNPDFQALRNNPDEMKKTVDKMDNYFGQRQTDMIMEVIGWERPASCPRDPARSEPPVLAEDDQVVEGTDLPPQASPAA